jgi:hypothetical protein
VSEVTVSGVSPSRFSQGPEYKKYATGTDASVPVTVETARGETLGAGGMASGQRRGDGEIVVLIMVLMMF